MARVYKNKNNQNWYFTIELPKENGKRKRINRVGGKTKKEALEKLRKFQNELSEYGEIKKESELTVDEYIDYFKANYMEINLKPSTLRNKTFLIDKHIRSEIGCYKLKAITPNLLNSVIVKKVKGGYSKNYVATILNYIKLMFRYSVHPAGFIKNDPAIYLELPRIEEEPKKRIYLTQKEISLIRKEFMKKESYQIVFEIGYHTGMRIGEILGLKWSCIDFTKSTIRVDKALSYIGKGQYELTSPKSKSSIRTIKIGKTLVNILKQKRKIRLENKFKYGKFYEDNDFVCTKKEGTLIGINTIKSFCGSIKKRTNINFSFHKIRHTHATLLIEAGANMKSVQDRLGHNQISVTMDTYAHVTNKMSDETIELFEKII